jgi:hypothetical protein
MSPAARRLAVLGSLAGFNATGPMNQRAVEPAP